MFCKLPALCRGNEEVYLSEDPIKLSQLFVLRVLRHMGAEARERELRDALHAEFVVDAGAKPFTLGAQRSFRDFLVELDAGGFLRLEQGDGDAHVALTDHGRSKLERAESEGFAAYHFA